MEGGFVPVAYCCCWIAGKVFVTNVLENRLDFFLQIFRGASEASTLLLRRGCFQVFTSDIH